MGGKVHSLSPLDTRQQTTYTTVLDSTYYEKLVEAAATKAPWQPNELNILWNKHMCPEFFFPLWIITFENVGHHHCWLLVQLFIHPREFRWNLSQLLRLWAFIFDLKGQRKKCKSKYWPTTIFSLDGKCTTRASNYLSKGADYKSHLDECSRRVCFHCWYCNTLN